LTSSAPLPTDIEVYVAASYNYTGNSAVLYSNAVRVATGPAAVPLNLINDVNNWLGRSQWNDGMFLGSYNEFGSGKALSAEQVAANYAAGPNQLPEPSTPPTLAIVRSGANVVISWPASATATTTGFQLEVTPTIGSGAAWTTVDTSGAVEEGGLKSSPYPSGARTSTTG
jgi:hypothetical protein